MKDWILPPDSHVLFLLSTFYFAFCFCFCFLKRGKDKIKNKKNKKLFKEFC